MEKEGPAFRVEIRHLIDHSVERRERLSNDLEELRAAIKVIEKQARRLEREIAREDEFIKRLEVGEIRIEASAEPARDAFANMSIPDAAAEAIQELQRPLHVGELLDVLEAGGKRFGAARPAVSIASALSRDARFKRVKPNTFDLVERTQPKLPIE